MAWSQHRAIARRKSALHKFLVAQGAEEYEDKLRRVGVVNVDDIRRMSEADLEDVLLPRDVAKKLKAAAAPSAAAEPPLVQAAEPSSTPEATAKPTVETPTRSAAAVPSTAPAADFC